VTDTRRRARRWPLIAIAALTVGWLVAPAATPLYDGPLQPDEPYRYVAPPPGSPHTPPPTTATATLTVTNGRNDAGYANSSEVGPQISVYMPPTSLAIPFGASSVKLTATPEAPTRPLPTNGTIVTNVYRIAATTPAGPARIVGTGNAAPTMQMRAPSGRQPGPKFEHLTSSGWVQSKPTLRVGNDIYQTQFNALGDWALVQLGGSGATKSSSGGIAGNPLLWVGIALLVLAGIVIAIRTSRLRKGVTV
jgi:hypothetical protein